MPVPPAELTARFKVEGPGEALAAAREAAAPSKLVRDAGPGELALTGPHDEVLEAFGAALAAALEAGATGLDASFEAPQESRG
jgi:hypothetical protein